MNANNFETEPRVLLPRWIPTDLQHTLPSTKPFISSSDVIVDTFEEHKQDWQRDKNLSSAEALVSYAIATNRPIESELERAALFIIDRAPNSLIARHAKRAVQGFPAHPDDKEIHGKIARARRIARFYPYSSLLWSDLAYYHCLAGNHESARKAAITADKVSIGTPAESLPISRCMVHLSEPDFALRAIRKTTKSFASASAICAEMAISHILGVSPQSFRAATRLAISGKLSPQEDALIRAAVATELVNSGSDRKAKKLLSSKTLHPEENTLAQLVWLSTRLDLEIDPISKGVDKAYEAACRSAYNEKNYKKCIKAAELWSDYQPFSVTAISFGSYVAGFLTDDHDRSLNLLIRGQVVGPQSFTIWNNSAFDYAKLNRLDEALRALHIATRNAEGDVEHDVLTATKGLYLIRSGAVSLGEHLYRQAIQGFMSRKDLRSASIASLMYAEEMALIGRPDAVALLEQANTLAQEGNHVGVLDAIRAIRKKAISGF
jgi:tetratricopeptide (TPR) repeat protein